MLCSCFIGQVIVTCRTEYLEAKGAYRGLFTPGDGPHATSQLQELFVRSFGGDQVSQYFTQWVKQRGISSGGADNSGSDWTAQRYVTVIEQTPGLKELAQNPFVLRAMADALPRLDRQSNGGSSSATGRAVSAANAGPLAIARSAVTRNTVTKRKVTRADVYAAFVDQCWEVETQRLRRNWPAGLPVDYDGPRSFTNYCVDLAVEMLARGQVCLCR